VQRKPSLQTARAWGCWALAPAGVFVAMAVAWRLPAVAPIAPYVGPVLMLYLPVLRTPRGAERDYGWHLPARGGWMALAVSSVVIFAAFYAVTRWWMWGPWGLPAAGLATQLLRDLLFAALPEEFFFRGWLQPRAHALTKAALPLPFGLRLSAANVVTSLAFALLHLAVAPAPDRLWVFFPSLWYGWLHERGDSVAGPIIAHAASNTLLAMALAGPAG